MNTFCSEQCPALLACENTVTTATDNQTQLLDTLAAGQLSVVTLDGKSINVGDALQQNVAYIEQIAAHATTIDRARAGCTKGPVQDRRSDTIFALLHAVVPYASPTFIVAINPTPTSQESVVAPLKCSQHKIRKALAHMPKVVPLLIRKSSET